MAAMIESLYWSVSIERLLHQRSAAIELLSTIPEVPESEPEQNLFSTS